MHEAERKDRTLRRIIATLVALAELAERVACRSLPLRWLVLCLLRHAEVVARDHVAETTGWDWSDLEYGYGIDDALDTGFDTNSGSGPADALALASRLRLLASILGALLPPDDAGFDRQPSPTGRSAARAEAALDRLAIRLALLLESTEGLAHQAPDTS